MWRMAVLVVAIALVGPARADEADEAEVVAASAKDRAKVYAVDAKVLPIDGRVLAIDGKVLEIKGLASEIAGATHGIEGAPKEIQASLKDLRAKVTETEIRIELSGDVLFDFDKHTLRKDALASLDKLGQVVKGYGGTGKITVEGFTDAKGKDSYNLKLSERRADTVKDWLVKHAGVAPARISSKGWGKAKPVAPNTKPDGSDDPEGRQKNRRVEIVIRKG